MTTLAANKERRFSITYDDFNELPAIGSDILYQGSAMGAVDGTGYIRPLAAGDKFAGWGDAKADNASGSSGDINVNLRKRGRVELTITGVTITDYKQPVYATDDDTFTMSPIGSSFIGFVHRWVSSGKAIVVFDADNFADPYGAYSKREVISANKTLDIEDNGKLFWVDTDAVVISMPAVATPVNCVIVNGGSFGAVAVSISPVAADKMQGPDLPGTDNKDLINTKATARRGDLAQLVTGDANGPLVSRLVGTWATEG